MNVAYAYDSAGRFSAVTNIINGVTNTASYAYLPSSHLLTGYTLGALTRTVDFEPDRNLIDMATTTHGTNLISRFDYTNDPIGRRTQRLDTTGTAGFQPATNSFAYNVRSELTAATLNPLGAPSTSSATYQYDPIGNRIQAVENTVQTDYVSNMLNQYTGINTNTPSYDDDGNMLFLPSTTGGGKQFTWDGENRMITTTNGNTVVVNTYDAQSRRIRKQVSVDGTPAKDIRYFYDAWNLLYEHDLLAGGSGSTRHYAWGLDLSQSLQGAGGVGGLLYTQAGTSANAPSYDANGNVTEYVDLATGAVTSRHAYDGFGKTIAQTGTRPAPYAFSTKYEDEDTGLLYYGYRFYAPEVGRWPNRDPIGERGGSNIYTFTHNNLVSEIDVLGLAPRLCGIDRNGMPIYCDNDPPVLIPVIPPILPPIRVPGLIDFCRQDCREHYIQEHRKYLDKIAWENKQCKAIASLPGVMKCGWARYLGLSILCDELHDKYKLASEKSLTSNLAYCDTLPDCYQSPTEPLPEPPKKSCSLEKETAVGDKWVCTYLCPGGRVLTFSHPRENGPCKDRLSEEDPH